MAIDKELFYASHGLKYTVVARPYTDDMEVKKKFFTKADMVAMLEELKKEIEEIPNSYEYKPIGTYDYSLGAEHERKVNLEIIQQQINKLKGEEDGNE